MRFNPKARIDQSQVQTRRGGGGLGGGGMRLPMPGGGGGRGGKIGIGTILLVIAFVVLTQCVGGGVGLPGGAAERGVRGGAPVSG